MSSTDNTPSIAICRKLGFARIEVREVEFPKRQFMSRSAATPLERASSGGRVAQRRLGRQRRVALHAVEVRADTAT
jgi:hypothetical protein